MQMVVLKANGQEVAFSLDKPSGIPTPNAFNTIYGIGKPAVSVNETQGAYQQGATFHGANTNPRDIELNIYHYGETDKDMYRAREALSTVISGNDNRLRLEYYNDVAGWYIYGIVVGDDYGEKIRNGGTFMPRKLVIRCVDPILRKIGVEEELELLYKGGSFYFPFYLPPEGVKFGVAGYEGDVYNGGSAKMPVEMHIYGPAYHPMILNTATGYAMGFTVSLSAYQKLYINTAQGAKTIEIQNIVNGSVTSGWDFWVSGAHMRMWDIVPGVNKLQYRNIGHEDMQATKIVVNSAVGSWSV